MMNALPASTVLVSGTTETTSDLGEHIRGSKVVDRNGKPIGVVTDVLIDPWRGKTRMLRVDHSGLLGSAAAPLFLPVEVVQQVTTDQIRIDRSRTEVADGPQYSPETVDGEAFYTNVFSHYGYLPYWTPGYLSPARDPLGHKAKIGR
jgi:sporulation protein YlmC with PRC-barrel domain